MDPTAPQSAPPLIANTQYALPKNSPILQFASGFSMAPPPGFFAPSPVHSLGYSFPLTLATIPSSATTVSTHSRLPSIASIVPNTHLHGAAVVPLSNTHQVISLKVTNNNYLYWRMQMKPYLLGKGVYAFCWRVLSLSCTLLLPTRQQLLLSIHSSFHGSNKTN